MTRTVAGAVAVLAVASALGFARPAAAQYGPQPGYRPPLPRPYPQQPAPYGYGYDEGAYAHGRADGYEQGFEDARDRDAYDPRRNRRYRSADRGYHGWYGPKEYFRQAYRQGFLDGYERGYRDGRRYRGPRPGPGARGGGWFGFGWRY